jgi:hypothetical protein
MDNCTCKAEHWQWHKDGCPLAAQELSKRQRGSLASKERLQEAEALIAMLSNDMDQHDFTRGYLPHWRPRLRAFLEGRPATYNPKDAPPKHHETTTDRQPMAWLGFPEGPAPKHDLVYDGTRRLDGYRYTPVWRPEDHPAAVRSASKTSGPPEDPHADRPQEFA